MSAIDDLTTPVHPSPYETKITYADAIIMAGSCFAEHINEKMLRYKYDVLSNPFGILFNPVSIARSFERIANHEFYQDSELIFHDGLYHSLDHHGSYSGKDKTTVLNSINSAMEKAAKYLSSCKFVFVSLGSAKVHRYRETSAIAGNCHKIPQSSFDSYRLTVDECIAAIERTVKAIRKNLQDVHIIWTVSPVRHLKDGVEENQRSKATLILAIDQHLKDKQNEAYFPAYEIMMDSLRDYRFYERDLTHPSSLAVDIIWDIFEDTYLDPQDKSNRVLIEKVRRAMEHRIIHDNKEALKSFADAQLKQIDLLANQYPKMDWREERQYFFHLSEPD